MNHKQYKYKKKNHTESLENQFLKATDNKKTLKVASG